MSEASIGSAPTPEAAVRWLTGRSNAPVAAQGAAGRADSTRTAPAQRTTSVEQVQAAVSAVAEFVSDYARELQFRVDDASGKTVITVRNATTDEVVRQIPSEEVLELAARIREASDTNGVLMRARA
jgi:flagellar protein FlaG